MTCRDLWMDAPRMQSSAAAAAPSLGSGKEGKKEWGPLRSLKEETPSRALLHPPAVLDASWGMNSQVQELMLQIKRLYPQSPSFP